MKAKFKLLFEKIKELVIHFFKGSEDSPSGLKVFLKSEGFKTFLSSLICIAGGLFVGLIIFLIVNPQNAFTGFITILKGGFNAPNTKKGIGLTIVSFIPLLLCSLSIIFSYKCGLFNIGAPGQYVIGLMFAFLGVFLFKLPWYLCLLLAMIGGAIWGAIPGIFKAYLNVNEVITSIMFNWIGLYVMNYISGDEVGLMYNKSLAECYEVPLKSQLPVIGKQLFGGYDRVTIALFITIIVAIAIQIVLKSTKFGYEIKATGLNMKASKYAGMNHKKNIIITMAISGAIAGLAAACYYLNNAEIYSPTKQTALPVVGFNGIAVAFLGGLDPIGAIFSALFITHITRGGGYLDTTYFSSEIANLISAIIIYLCAFSLFIKGLITKREKNKESKKQLERLPRKSGGDK